MKRALILVLDSFGIGASRDAVQFGDQGADTLGHIADYCLTGRGSGALRLPNLSRLGLFHAAHASSGRFPAGCATNTPAEGAWGYAAEVSSGKDTPSGHWEITGVPVKFDWGYFPEKQNSFPPELLDALIQQAELPGVLGNCHASGTEIIARLGEAHVRSGKPIVYTSSDSVFQIAAHETHFGLDRLLKLCETARTLVDAYGVGRVIARPFTGESADTFTRTDNRKDLTTPPPEPTLLDKMIASGGEVIGIGKIADIFAHQGISRTIKAAGNEALFDATVNALKEAPDRSIVFTNFVDFDMLYGHRRDTDGYASALEALDCRLPELEQLLQAGDVMILCADHGCDPTWPGSDHTREHIPVLVSGKGIKPGPLGDHPDGSGYLNTFADIGQSLAAYFELSPMGYGRSFL